MNTKMARLVDMAIDEHVIPDQVNIQEIANECFIEYMGNFQAAYSAFSYQIPEKIPRISSKSLKSLMLLMNHYLKFHCKIRYTTGNELGVV